MVAPLFAMLFTLFAMLFACRIREDEAEMIYTMICALRLIRLKQLNDIRAMLFAVNCNFPDSYHHCSSWL